MIVTWPQFAGALSERDELKKQLEAVPTVGTTPTPQSNDVIALQETVAELQEKLLEKDASSSSGNADMERELEEKSVSGEREGGIWKVS